VGSVHEATCECGFRTDVTVGGGMADFTENAPFPFYCERCAGWSRLLLHLRPVSARAVETQTSISTASRRHQDLGKI
jgi:hypothetical protein